MSKWVILPAAVLCALAAVLLLRFLGADRDLVAATPSPRPMFTVTYVRIPASGQLCLSDVTIPASARQLRLQVRTFGRPGPALAVELRAPGYEQRHELPADYPDGAVLVLPIEPPPEDALGSVCLTAERAVALVGTTEERTQSRPAGALDGNPIAADTYLVFYAGRSASALSQTGAIVERMAAFRPAGVGQWLLWPLLALVVVGIPAGVLAAVTSAVRA
jgi:hypothetical protein